MSASDSTASAMSAWEWPKKPAVNLEAVNRPLTPMPTNVARNPRCNRAFGASGITKVKVKVRVSARGTVSFYLASLSLSTLTSLYHMVEHGIAQLGLEPGALGRHDAVGIGDGHQVADACR